MVHNKISVIIPVYNVEKYLERCLDSVIANSYENLEIICINDGSTDNSYKILQEYAEKDARICLISKKNGGVSSARNAGLKVSTGEYITFVDSDDWVHKEYFMYLFQVITTAEADIAVCGHRGTTSYVEDEIIEKRQLQYRSLGIEEFFHSNSIKRVPWGKIYKKTLIKDMQFTENVSLAEDLLFNIEVVCSNPAIKIAVFDEKLYYYYERQESAVHLLSAEFMLPAVRSLFKHSKTTTFNMFINKYYLLETIKQCLAARYLGMFLKERKALNGECNYIIRSIIPLLWKNGKITKKEKVIYTIFWKIPLSYRFFRIINDKTMLEWEKKQRIIRRKTV